MRQECFDCHIKTVKQLIEKFQPAQETAELFLTAAKKLLNNKKDQSNPLMATDIHRLAKNLLGESNLYREEKSVANSILLQQYAYYEKWVNKQKSPRHAAAKLAVAGNIIDYGAHCVPDDLKLHMRQVLKSDLQIDDSQALFEAADKADSILYIGDNAGEIVFDKLFIESLQHPKITYAVRGKAVINDVTLEDTRQTDLDTLCRVITNGYDAPSTLLEYCSDEFVNEFYRSDLVISKGQGNFEGLMNVQHENLFYMLMAKCKPMAEMLNVSVGDMIIMKHRELPMLNFWKDRYAL